MDKNNAKKKEQGRKKEEHRRDGKTNEKEEGMYGK